MVLTIYSGRIDVEFPRRVRAYRCALPHTVGPGRRHHCMFVFSRAIRGQKSYKTPVKSAGHEHGS
jgi:hypothetical protein